MNRSQTVSGGSYPPERESPTANWAFSGNSPQNGADDIDYISSEISKVSDLIERDVNQYRDRLWVKYLRGILGGKP